MAGVLSNRDSLCHTRCHFLRSPGDRAQLWWVGIPGPGLSISRCAFPAPGQPGALRPGPGRPRAPLPGRGLLCSAAAPPSAVAMGSAPQPPPGTPSRTCQTATLTNRQGRRRQTKRSATAVLRLRQLIQTRPGSRAIPRPESAPRYKPTKLPGWPEVRLQCCSGISHEAPTVHPPRHPPSEGASPGDYRTDRIIDPGSPAPCDTSA